MKLMKFNSLEELNKYLEDNGMPQMDPSLIPRGVLPSSFTLTEGEDEEDNQSFENSSELDGYIAYSTRQLEHVMDQRDEARRMYEREVADHNGCHHNMDDALDQVRLQGYAEALAADRFPGMPMETLSDKQQKFFMSQADEAIKKIDAIRALMEDKPADATLN